MPVVCKKCGGKLDPKGNYCTECREPAYPSDEVEEEPKLPVKAILAGVAAFAILLAVVVFIRTRPLPPEKVAEKWTNLLLSYRIPDATKYTTSRYENANPIGGGRASSFEKADEFKDAVDNQGATYTFSKPIYSSGTPKTAKIKMDFKDANGDVSGYTITLVLQSNHQWLIDRVD